MPLGWSQTSPLGLHHSRQSSAGLIENMCPCQTTSWKTETHESPHTSEEDRGRSQWASNAGGSHLLNPICRQLALPCCSVQPWEQTVLHSLAEWIWRRKLEPCSLTEHEQQTQTMTWHYVTGRSEEGRSNQQQSISIFCYFIYFCTSKSEGIIALMTPPHLFDNFITRYVTDLVDKVYEVVKAPSTFRRWTH